MSETPLKLFAGCMDTGLDVIGKDSECEATDFYYDSDSCCCVTDCYEEVGSENEPAHLRPEVYTHPNKSDSREYSFLCTTIYPTRHDDPRKQLPYSVWKRLKQARRISKSTYFTRRLTLKGKDSTHSTAPTSCRFEK